MKCEPPGARRRAGLPQSGKKLADMRVRAAELLFLRVVGERASD
jgi:hypothetical protein